jgi:hypothetical protein
MSSSCVPYFACAGQQELCLFVEAQASPRDENVDQLQHEFYPPALRPSLNRINVAGRGTERELPERAGRPVSSL